MLDGGLGLCEGVSGSEASKTSRLILASLLKFLMSETSCWWAESAGCIFASFEPDVRCAASVKLRPFAGGRRGFFLITSGVFIRFEIVPVGTWVGCPS